MTIILTYLHRSKRTKFRKSCGLFPEDEEKDAEKEVEVHMTKDPHFQKEGGKL